MILNNAGVFSTPERLITQQGFETCFGVNHLGPFLLTQLLLDVLSPDGRVVTLSSGAHAAANINEETLKSEQKDVNDFVKYANSKLCNIFFTEWMAKNLENTKKTAYCCHPGTVRTNIF